MTSHLRVLITSAAVTSSALLVLGLAPLSAATSAGKPPPSACKTFTGKSADALFGVRHGTRLTRHLKNTGTGSNETSVCTVKHGKTTLTVTTSRLAGGFGGPFTCYKRPKLGTNGNVCVARFKSFPGTFALYEKHKVFFSDDFSKTLAHKGAALYKFALAQSRAYKG
jgi:hypothetical protein